MEFQRGEVREEFDHFDKDNNGLIDKQEFMALMETMGACLTQEELEVGFAAIDTNGNGKIEFEEFAAWWQDF